MLILFIFLWLIAAILIISNPKSERTRWGSAVAFFSGFGGLVVVIDDQIKPMILDNSKWLNIVDLTISIMDTLSYYIAPYTFIVFSIVFSGAINNKPLITQRIIKLVLLIPVSLMYLLYPVTNGFKPSYLILSAWVAPYVIGANILLLYSCFKVQNSKIRKQQILTTCLAIPPTMFSLMTNYLSSIFNVYNVWQYNVWIIALLFVFFIIFAVRSGVFNIRVRFEKNRFANLESIIDNISEGFIVIDENYCIIEMNQSFIRYFGKMSIGMDFTKAVIKCEPLSIVSERLIQKINKCREELQLFSLEDAVYLEEQGKSFSIDITPVYERRRLIGVAILFRDITELKNNIYLLEKNQNQIIENERLSSLGQLIGGISHNLRTPLLASSGGIDILSSLTREIVSRIEQSDIPEEERKSYLDNATEMMKWEESIRNYLSYMNSVITTLKGQVSPISDSSRESFTVNELLKGIDILMKHEFKKASVTIKYNIAVDKTVKILGNINFLLQVLDNIIINAIDSYEDKKGAVIEINIGCKDDKIDISVKDYGKGISQDIQGKLFKQMVTTKGKNGTGLGLYISKSIITSKFGGEIKVESSEGKGSTITIRLPYNYSH